MKICENREVFRGVECKFLILIFLYFYFCVSEVICCYCLLFCVFLFPFCLCKTAFKTHFGSSFLVFCTSITTNCNSTGFGIRYCVFFSCLGALEALSNGGLSLEFQT